MVERSSPILITGVGGLLGNALAAALRGRGESVVGIARNHLDISRSAEMASQIKALKPTRIINCAAHTDVEAAEVNPALDRAVNGVLPGVVAGVCADLNIPLVHFSSTGCYGDWKRSPYTEDDELRPLSKHHQAKLAGEQAVRASGCVSLIFRLGWLYGGSRDQPKNFVWKRIVEAAGKSEMISDDVQRGCPTFVDDVARQVLLAIDHRIDGTYNAVAGGEASRCEYVRAILAAAGSPCLVNAGSSFVRKAPVSQNETAQNARLQALGLNIMPEWQQSLNIYVDHLISQDSLV